MAQSARIIVMGHERSGGYTYAAQNAQDNRREFFHIYDNEEVNADQALAAGCAPPRRRFTRFRSQTIESLRRRHPQAGGAAARLPNRLGERARPRPLCPGVREARPLSDQRARLAGLLQARALRILGARSMPASDLYISRRAVSYASAHGADPGVHAVRARRIHGEGLRRG